jgi:hypothetical protein
MGKWLLSYWRGEKPLWKSFWLIWLLGGYINYTLAQFIASQFTLFGPVASYSLGLILILPFAIFSYVSVWRCAKNTQWGSILTYLVKGLMIFLAISYTMMGFATMGSVWRQAQKPIEGPPQTQQMMQY